jgi:hypothetical protein
MMDITRLDVELQDCALDGELPSRIGLFRFGQNRQLYDENRQGTEGRRDGEQRRQEIYNGFSLH